MLSEIQTLTYLQDYSRQLIFEYSHMLHIKWFNETTNAVITIERVVVHKFKKVLQLFFVLIFSFGICCVFVAADAGAIINQNCTYLRNPDFPSAYTGAGSLFYTVSKCFSGNEIAKCLLYLVILSYHSHFQIQMKYMNGRTLLARNYSNFKKNFKESCLGKLLLLFI